MKMMEEGISILGDRSMEIVLSEEDHKNFWKNVLGTRETYQK